MWFQVKRRWKFSRGDVICKVNLGVLVINRKLLQIQQTDKKSSFHVSNKSDGQLVAKVKQSSHQGFGYGDDVLTLEVEPHVDYSFIVALLDNMRDLIKRGL
ncbi:hypothetical protein HAX54_044529 [Datura stramonium]|uniref:Uncharacterized protein n=1 Tax=Datura stramonium TaxID=4076 RepID=A0ABS8RPJ9_DATST|nr:hypothetical protein [Datura stramonium]